ncbi:MAG: RNA polymerase sigma factor [Gemmatimonadetes bacterium]|nr:RNA polymerase sigma factor [Gemmatimonadota bacterium]MBT8403642.1 RNA polymerase sigma factor [Gemmatimonadota bacterium]NNK62003.1 RNA polymerase sigma factor [Gemmatimonadota bacterium]
MSLTDLTDEELEARLVALHADSFGWALNCCGHDDAEAEDVLQTTYVKILSRRATWAERSSFRTWVFGVIRFTALERGRRERALARRAERAGRLDPDDLVGTVPAPDEDLDVRIGAAANPQAPRLREALAAVSDRQREVLHLVFYQDMTVAEAADAMGVSVGSARTHYHRGKERLRALLAVEEPA